MHEFKTANQASSSPGCPSVLEHHVTTSQHPDHVGPGRHSDHIARSQALPMAAKCCFTHRPVSTRCQTAGTLRRQHELRAMTGIFDGDSISKTPEGPGLTLYTHVLCPYAQRCWIALQEKVAHLPLTAACVQPCEACLMPGANAGRRL